MATQDLLTRLYGKHGSAINSIELPAMSNTRRVALTFGSPAGINEVVASVGQVLGLTFELRESMYLGGDYYRSICAGYEVVVQQNDDLGEPAEPTHSDLPTLIRIDVTAATEPHIVTAIESIGLFMIDRTTREA